MGFPPPTEEEETFYKDRLKEAFKKVEMRLKDKGDYLSGDTPNLADFYALIWVMFPVESNLLTLEGHHTLRQWYDRMLENKVCASYRRKWIKTFKQGLFLVKYVLPVIKCMTCACCFSKKK